MEVIAVIVLVAIIGIILVAIATKANGILLDKGYKSGGLLLNIASVLFPFIVFPIVWLMPENANAKQCRLCLSFNDSDSVKCHRCGL